MTLPPAHPAEKLLSGGKPPGPQLDRLWAMLEARLDSPRPPWWKRMGWHLAWVPVLAAGALLLGTPPAWVPRGDARPAPPLLEASCGRGGPACAVGTPIYLQVEPYPLAGNMLLTQKRGGTRMVISQVETPILRNTVLPLKVIPEAVDVATGVVLETWWREASVQVQDLPPWLAHPTGRHGTLVLQVTP